VLIRKEFRLFQIVTILTSKVTGSPDRLSHNIKRACERRYCCHFKKQSFIPYLFATAKLQSFYDIENPLYAVLKYHIEGIFEKIRKILNKRCDYLIRK
jgi:hypothetical protein